MKIEPSGSVPASLSPTSSTPEAAVPVVRVLSDEVSRPGSMEVEQLAGAMEAAARARVLQLQTEYEQGTYSVPTLHLAARLISESEPKP